MLLLLFSDLTGETKRLVSRFYCDLAFPGTNRRRGGETSSMSSSKNWAPCCLPTRAGWTSPPSYRKASTIYASTKVTRTHTRARSQEIMSECLSVFTESTSCHVVFFVFECCALKTRCTFPPFKHICICSLDAFIRIELSPESAADSLVL